MSTAIKSLIQTGTKLWLDSVDPQMTVANRAMGITGATSNPIIIADLLKSGRFDHDMKQFARDRMNPEEITWQMTNRLVTEAEGVFKSVFDATRGNDGYVSFELDPLLEDKSCTLSIPDRSARYVELGKKWSKDHPNRMIKVPATPAGLGALEELAAAGIPLNVTLIFSDRQYREARDAVWRGAKRLKNLDQFKSVYSIFVSRIDVYTETKYPSLSNDAQGLAGIVNAKRIWAENHAFWAKNPTPLHQEMIFASTGTKKPTDKPSKYVAALAGSDIQTNPPATNDAVAKSDEVFTKQVDKLPAKPILDELLTKVDWRQLEVDLMAEGLAKFADPHKALIALVADRVK